MSFPATPLAQNFAAIRAKVGAATVASGRRLEDVTLIAVSKTQPVEAIEEIYRLGHRDFGENYVQELLEKADDLERRGCTGIRWHFIGHLQTNKVKALLAKASVVHTVDSVRLATEISKRWVAAGHHDPLPIFMEVNVDQEESKHGLSPDEVPEVARSIRELPGLRLQGLMCIPEPVSGSGEPARENPFARLREIGTRVLGKSDYSMGMTADFADAIAQGSTHVRVGTAIFGKR